MSNRDLFTLLTTYYIAVLIVVQDSTRIRLFARSLMIRHKCYRFAVRYEFTLVYIGFQTKFYLANSRLKVVFTENRRNEIVQPWFGYMKKTICLFHHRIRCNVFGAIGIGVRKRDDKTRIGAHTQHDDLTSDEFRYSNDCLCAFWYLRKIRRRETPIKAKTNTKVSHALRVLVLTWGLFE